MLLYNLLPWRMNWLWLLDDGLESWRLGVAPLQEILFHMAILSFTLILIAIICGGFAMFLEWDIVLSHSLLRENFLLRQQSVLEAGLEGGQLGLEGSDSLVSFVVGRIMLFHYL